MALCCQKADNGRSILLHALKKEGYHYVYSVSHLMECPLLKKGSSMLDNPNHGLLLLCSHDSFKSNYPIYISLFLSSSPDLEVQFPARHLQLVCHLLDNNWRYYYMLGADTLFLTSSKVSSSSLLFCYLFLIFYFVASGHTIQLRFFLEIFPSFSRLLLIALILPS